MGQTASLPEDPYILLSFINMKLRDEYLNLSVLSEDLNVSLEDIIKSLKTIGYIYNDEVNQFKSE